MLDEQAWPGAQPRPRPFLALLVVPVLLMACQTSDRPSGGSPERGRAQTSVYFVSRAEGWTSREAYKPPPDHPVVSRSEPTLDWYAEYERYPEPSHSELVRLSGHDLPMRGLEGTLAGFDSRTRTVRGLAAKVGSGPDGPRVVLLPVASGYTVMALSYELGIDELVEWSEALEAVDEREWVARGGVIGR